GAADPGLPRDRPARPGDRGAYRDLIGRVHYRAERHVGGERPYRPGARPAPGCAGWTASRRTGARLDLGGDRRRARGVRGDGRSAGTARAGGPGVFGHRDRRDCNPPRSWPASRRILDGPVYLVVAALLYVSLIVVSLSVW